MKIAKRQLQRIIKEELSAILGEDEVQEGLMDTLRGYTKEKPGWENERDRQHAESPEGKEQAERLRGWENDKLKRYPHEAAWNRCRMGGKSCEGNDYSRVYMNKKAKKSRIDDWEAKKKERYSELNEAEKGVFDPDDVKRARADRLGNRRKQTHGREGNLTDVGFLEGLEHILWQKRGQEYADKIAKRLGFDYSLYNPPSDWTNPLEKVGDNPPDRSGFWERFNEEKERLGEKFPYEVIDVDSSDYDLHGGGTDRWKISVVAADEGPALDEKKKDDFLGDVKSTGEWTDITIAQLKKKIAAANKKQEKYKKKHDGKAKKSITKLLRQMNFSKNAKEGDYK